MLTATYKNPPGFHGAGAVGKDFDSKARFPFDGEASRLTEGHLSHDWSNLPEDLIQCRSARIIDRLKPIECFRSDSPLRVPHVVRSNDHFPFLQDPERTLNMDLDHLAAMISELNYSHVGRPADTTHSGTY
jgi:hypothetical protein